MFDTLFTKDDMMDMERGADDDDDMNIVDIVKRDTSAVEEEAAEGEAEALDREKRDTSSVEAEASEQSAKVEDSENK